MENARFIQLLNTLNPRERTEFRKWIGLEATPKKGGRLTLLYDSILNLIAKGGTISKGAALSPLLGEEKVQLNEKEDKLLRNLLYDLTNYIREYLAWIKLKQKDQLKERLVQDELLERKAYALLEAENDKTRRSISKKQIQNVDYFESFFQVEEMNFFLSILLRNRDRGDHLTDLISSIDHTFLSRVLKYYCAAKTKEQVLGNHYELPFKGFVLDYLDETHDRQPAFIRVFYLLYRMLSEKDGYPYFKQAGSLFRARIESFAITDQRHILNLLINYGTRQVKLGNSNMEVEKSELYRLGIIQRVWVTDLYFSEQVFIQIVKNAIAIRKLDDARDFVITYSRELSPLAKENIPHYAYALIYFSEKNFGRASQEKNLITTSTDFSYYMDYNILSLKIYYEQLAIQLGSENMQVVTQAVKKSPILSILEALRQYLSERRNKKMGETNRMTYTNFVKVFHKVWRKFEKWAAGKPLSEEQLAILKQEIIVMRPLTERGWLLEKIDELIEWQGEIR